MSNRNRKQPDYCKRRQREVDACWTQHYARWRSVIGTDLYVHVVEHVRTSSSTCFALAREVLGECGGASFGRR